MNRKQHLIFPSHMLLFFLLSSYSKWDVVNFGGKAMQSLGEVWVSLGRLEHLLRMPELPSYRLEVSLIYFRYHALMNTKHVCNPSNPSCRSPSLRPQIPP